MLRQEHLLNTKGQQSRSRVSRPLSLLHGISWAARTKSYHAVGHRFEAEESFGAGIVERPGLALSVAIVAVRDCRSSSGQTTFTIWSGPMSIDPMDRGRVPGQLLTDGKRASRHDVTKYFGVGIARLDYLI